MATGKVKYGVNWPANTEDLLIEFSMIRGGGFKTVGKQMYGLGLYEHYKKAMQIMWPEDDWHRWVEVCLRTASENMLCSWLGCSDSGKSFIAAKWALTEYWASPESTLVLVSSTDVRGLELRIWGAIKTLFNRARQHFPDLPGHPLDSLHAIADQQIDEEGETARALNRGIICIPCLQSGRYVGIKQYVGIKAPRLRQVNDECFPAGTEVNTPSGNVAIENIRVGDIVYSAVLPRRVTATSIKSSKRLIRLSLSDGRKLDCTPNHPVLTRLGWKMAIDIQLNDHVLSRHETMQVMRDGYAELEIPSKILQSNMSKKDMGKSVQGVRSVFHPIRATRGFLFKELLNEMEVGQDRYGDKDFGQPRSRSIRQEGECYDHGESNRTKTAQQIDEGSASEYLIQEKAWRSLGRPWLRSKTNSGRAGFVERVSGGAEEFLYSDGQELKKRASSTLLFRRGVAGIKIKCRSGRQLPRPPSAAVEGLGANEIPFGTRVDSVEVLEPGNDPRYIESEGGYRVYNLQVEGHPTYSVNGIIVHNCNMMGPTHLDALANFVGKDYKALFLFNPTDPLDPGGKVAEPLGGWEAFPEPQKTTVWKTKMLGGAAVNLVGSDSPNYDFAEDKYPYLIGRRKFAFVESHFGKDSLQYYSQCMGVMKTGILARRVITRDLCVANRAFDKAIWEGTPTTRIWALDAAYGGIGGDRCEFMWGEFGESEEGQQILRLNAPELVPVSIKVKTRTPEQQIAEWIKGRISILGIGPERGGYDSTGRGTLGNAFAKEFGTTTPLPIEFGGRPSVRPVRHDLFIGEGAERRLMRCDEHFYDFVSELWMMTRYIVECQQIRELPLSVMEEGQQREYGHHKKKVFVESKNDLKAKERMPRSPDEYDCFVTLCEVARRLGFQLSKLGVSKKEVDNQESWWEKDNQKQKDIYRRAVLVHG